MATNVDLRHSINCSEDQFWTDVHFSREFNDALFVDFLEYGYEIIEKDDEKGIRKVKVTPKVNLPKSIAKVLGPTVAFNENGQLGEENGKRVYRFTVIPGVFSDKISIKGHMTTEPNGEGKCFRVVHFDFTCGIFGIGKIVEHFSAKEIEASYEQSWKFTNDYLAKQG